MKVSICFAPVTALVASLLSAAAFALPVVALGWTVLDGSSAAPKSLSVYELSAPAAALNSVAIAALVLRLLVTGLSRKLLSATAATALLGGVISLTLLLSSDPSVLAEALLGSTGLVSAATDDVTIHVNWGTAVAILTLQALGFLAAAFATVGPRSDSPAGAPESRRKATQDTRLDTWNELSRGSDPTQDSKLD